MGAEDDFLFATSLMRINATAGATGVCPILLVFGPIPKLLFPETGPAAVPQKEGLMIMETTREKYMNLVDKMQFGHAEMAFVPRTPRKILKHGDKDLVYHDKTVKCQSRKRISRQDNVILVP